MPIALKIFLTIFIIFALSGIIYSATENKTLKKIMIFSGGLVIGMLFVGIWCA